MDEDASSDSSGSSSSDSEMSVHEGNDEYGLDPETDTEGMESMIMQI